MSRFGGDDDGGDGLCQPEGGGARRGAARFARAGRGGQGFAARGGLRGHQLDQREPGGDQDARKGADARRNGRGGAASGGSDSAAQLRKANLRIEGLEKTIADLQTRLGEKGEEIVALKEQLDRREAEVAELQERVEVQNERIEELASETSELQGRMNTVYYIVGSERELRNAQIIDKQGFIGRTVTLAKGGNLDCFTRADARLLEELPIGHKRVQVVTSHPEDSYRLVTGADKVVASLVILDPEPFWESSRILVVAYR